MPYLRILMPLAFIFFIILNIIFSASGIAFNNINQGKLADLISKGPTAKTKNLEKLLSKGHRLHLAILVWNTFLILILGAIITYWSILLLPYRFFIHALILAGVFLLLSFIIVISQKIAAFKSLEIALWLAPFFVLITEITYPLINFFFTLANPITKLFNIDLKTEIMPLTEEEIRLLVTEGKKQGIIEKEEHAMIHSILGFGDTIVKEVMVPRINMICLDSKAALSDFLETILNYGFSRIPVFEKTIDNIIGIAHARDLLIYSKNKDFSSPVKEIIRPANFVPNSKKVSDLLREMQHKKISIAIAVDEYGGTDGLVTTEDLVEEIVGEIIDEYDKSAQDIEIDSSGEAVIESSMIIEDVNEKLNLNIPADKFETIGGFVYGKLDRVPKEGEEIILDNSTLIVEKVQHQKIKKIRVRRKTLDFRP